MISHQEKCVFVHIPKAAGQSVEKVFVERAGLTWEQRAPLLLRPNDNPKLGPPRLAHLTASEYVSLGYLSQAQYDALFSFSFVRNPWDRLVSEYNYRRQHKDAKYLCDFKTFLFNNFPTPADDDYSRAKDYYRHVIPQADFLYDEHDNCLVDFIGRFESLQSDFDIVCQNLNLGSLTLPHFNKTQPRGMRAKLKRLLPSSSTKKPQRKHYSDYYDLESKEYVAGLYRRDIELLNYEFLTLGKG